MEQYGFQDLHPELQAEVAQHAWPEDRESLSRTNRHLRATIHHPNHHETTVHTQEQLVQALNNPALTVIRLAGEWLTVNQAPAAPECQIIAKADNVSVRAAATVHVHDNVRVHAYDGAVIEAAGDADIAAMGCRVTARGNARINAWSCEVTAYEDAYVHAAWKAKVWATDNTRITARSQATITGLANTVRIWADDTATTTDTLPGTVLTIPTHDLPHPNNFDWTALEALWHTHAPQPDH
ncbi:hypothetical protein AB0N09_42980 [Streptomyces erythrochromogenes]|uniref:hypothetical protein n=1 Tax=Streptomyces erythrochromogenes TaxID=285574 RepID=UPI00342CB202